MVVLGAAVGGLLLVAVVVLLALTLAELRDSRNQAEITDARVAAILKTTRPALTDVPELVDDAQPVLDRAAPVLGRALALAPRIEDVVTRLPLLVAGAQTFVGEAVPLVRGLSASDIPGLVGELRASDLPGVVDAIEASDLPATTASLQQLVSDLSTGDRLAQSLDVTTSLLTEVATRGLPEKAVASTRRIRQLLETQRQTFLILQRSLGIQRRTLSHTKSIDNKLGGQLPPELGGLTAP